MKKRFVVLMLAMLVAWIAAAPALAAEPGPEKKLRCRLGQGVDCSPGKPLFTLVGVIKSVTSIDQGSLTVQVYHGNRFAQPYIEEVLTVELTENTDYRRWDPSGCVPINFEEVEEGDTTSIHGVVEGGTFVAGRVTVGVPLDCCTPPSPTN